MRRSSRASCAVASAQKSSWPGPIASSVRPFGMGTAGRRPVEDEIVTKGKIRRIEGKLGTKQRNLRPEIRGTLKPRRGFERQCGRACVRRYFAGGVIRRSSSYSHVSRSASASFPLTEAMRTGEGLNVSTRRGLIGTSIPVLGLRPIRSRFDRTENKPKERSLTASPRTRASEISSRAISKMSRAWARDSVRQES